MTTFYIGSTDEPENSLNERKNKIYQEKNNSPQRLMLNIPAVNKEAQKNYNF